MDSQLAIKKIKKEFDEKKNSHIFLVETNDIEKSVDDIKNLLADLLSKGDKIIENQVKNETYLEMIIIRSEGKIIKTDTISELQDRLKTKPVLSDYIAYIIAPAEDMNESASNKLLKTIEEPNQNVVGFLITKNADLLLPTIKSRCEKISMIYEIAIEQDPGEEIKEIVKNIIISFEEQNHPKLYKIKSSNKNLKENSQIIENMIKDYYNMACDLKKKSLDENLVKYLKQNNNCETLIKKAKYINSTLTKLTRNMSLELMLEKMFFDLKEVNKDDNSRS